MSVTVAAPALPHEPGFFQRDLPAYAILASFLVLTLPLTLLTAYAPDSPRIRAVLVVYIFVLGPILSGVHATSEVAQYLPYQAGNALGRLTSSVDTAMLGQAAGGLVLLAWALAFAA